MNPILVWIKSFSKWLSLGQFVANRHLGSPFLWIWNLTKAPAQIKRPKITHFKCQIMRHKAHTIRVPLCTFSDGTRIWILVESIKSQAKIIIFDPILDLLFYYFLTWLLWFGLSVYFFLEMLFCYKNVYARIVCPNWLLVQLEYR